MQPDYDPSTEDGTLAQPNGCIQLVASRREALETLQSAASAVPPRPVLITGEPGAGKSSLVRRFAAEASTAWRTASVDLAAEMNAAEFLRLVGHPVGVSASSRLGKARLRLQGALADESTEGRRWLLVVNEAHRGRSGVWDELQAIANQLGGPRGFAALFVVGATDLPRVLVSKRSSIGLAALVSTHIHLKPIDLDEARELLGAVDSDGAVEERVLEELHRKSQGNPALLLRLARTWSHRHRVDRGSGALLSDRFALRGLERRGAVPPAYSSDLVAEARPDLSHEVVKEQNGSNRPTTRGLGRAGAPALVPSKPPIRDEEGLVEVGWEGDLEDELAGTETRAADQASIRSDQSLNEELIEDRYAALQAISERRRNEGWLTTSAPAATAGETSGDLADTEELPAEQPVGRPSEAATAPGGIRAEGQHEFAPYSQLFTRFRQSK
jgi:type II secretory pathway predicted ATPase ExeA